MKKARAHILIVLYGNSDDIYKSIREKSMKEEKFVAQYLDCVIGDVFNYAVQKCSELKFPYFVISNISIKEVGDWSELIFRLRTDKAFLRDSGDYYFTIFNFNVVRKFGKFKVGSAPVSVFSKWLEEKARVAGAGWGELDDAALSCIENIDVAEIHSKKKKKHKRYGDTGELEDEQDVLSRSEGTEEQQTDF